MEEESSWSAPPPAAQLLLTIHPQEKVYHEGAKKLRGLSGSQLLGASSSPEQFGNSKTSIKTHIPKKFKSSGRLNVLF